MKIDVSSYWVATWNHRNGALQAEPLLDYLRETNRELMSENKPERIVITIGMSIGECQDYVRSIRAMLKKHGEVENASGHG